MRRPPKMAGLSACVERLGYCRWYIPFPLLGANTWLPHVLFAVGHLVLDTEQSSCSSVGHQRSKMIRQNEQSGQTKLLNPRVRIEGKRGNWERWYQGTSWRAFGTYSGSYDRGSIDKRARFEPRRRIWKSPTTRFLKISHS